MKTIKFENQGQDFLEWIINDDVIIDCQPFQFKFWVGKKVRIEGGTIYVKANEFKPLQYPIKSIAETDQSYVDGFTDGLQGKEPQAAFAESDQYKFGFNVAHYNLTLGNTHARLG